MASSSQILKYNLSALPLSNHQPNFPGKSTWFFSEHSPSRSRSVLALRRSSSGSKNLARKRFAVICSAQDSDKENNGEEPPESLFMKELRRRGMSPTSLLEETNTSDYGGESVAFSQISTKVEKSLFNQRERSMMLNSEGLEGLFPRAKVLVTLGGTFFFGFWPLILVTIALFTALYFYFGTAFVHDGSKIPVLPPHYIDPYALLEEERISQMAPNVN